MGIDIEWNYDKQMCHLFMHGYINEVLLKYNHPKPCKSLHAPHAHHIILYGATEQLLPDKDNSPPLSDNGIKHIQGIISLLLYYAQAIDNKLLATLSTISSQQAKATKNTAKVVHQLLDYVATYLSEGITY